MTEGNFYQSPRESQRCWAMTPWPNKPKPLIHLLQTEVRRSASICLSYSHLLLTAKCVPLSPPCLVSLDGHSGSHHSFSLIFLTISKQILATLTLKCLWPCHLHSTSCLESVVRIIVVESVREADRPQLKNKLLHILISRLLDHSEL